MGSLASAARMMPDALREPHDEILDRLNLRGRDLVLYDGECGLCDRSVRFLAARDRSDRLRFAPLQSAWAKFALARHGLRERAGDSMHVCSEIGTPAEKLYLRSRAALRMAKALKWPWCLLRVAWLIPLPLRDWGYDFIARHRQRWFRPPTCSLHERKLAHLEHKLLDDQALSNS